MIVFVLLSIIFSLTAAACPAGTDPVKIKYNQLDTFQYQQGCITANSTDQSALLGSQSALNCGVDGYPFVVLTNLEHWTFAKNLCMTVHGAKHVYIFYRKLGIPGFHVEVVPNSGWNRVCFSDLMDGHEAYVWLIQVHPALDGSETRVKNLKLASCQFPTIFEQVKPLNPSGSQLGYGGYVVY